MAYCSDKLRSAVITFLKVVIAVGITLATLGLILFFTEHAYNILPSWHIQLTIAAIVVAVMSYISLKLFEGL